MSLLSAVQKTLLRPKIAFTAIQGQQIRNFCSPFLATDLPANLHLADEPRPRVPREIFTSVDLSDPRSFEVPLESLFGSAPQEKILLDSRIFGVTPRVDILHDVVRWQRAKKQQGTHKTKTRSEVSGGGRKPRPQKGGGTSRQGSIRAPHFKGGGKAHGPVVRSHAIDLNKKVRKMGLRMALSTKLREGKLTVLDHMVMEEPKTRLLRAALQEKGWQNALFIDDDFDYNFELSCSNLMYTNILEQRGANVFDILKHHRLILTVDAVKKLEERLQEVSSVRYLGAGPHFDTEGYFADQQQ